MSCTRQDNKKHIRGFVGVCVPILLFLLVSLAPVEALTYSLQYDSNGNIIKDNRLYYEYNLFNQLSKVKIGNSTGLTLEEYWYDGAGVRVKKVNYNLDGTNTTTYYIGGNFVREITNGTIKDTVYIYDSDGLVASRSGNSTSYYHNDHLGSTDVITDKTGEVVQEFDYLPFGEQVQGNGSRYTYTGKEKDLTGLSYYESRYYNPVLARFTQPDTVIQDFYDPQSLNRYAYARNNPIKYNDPSGHFAETLLDIAFIAYDLYSIVKDPFSWESYTSLGLDVACAFVPFATGGGAALKAFTNAGKSVNKAKNIKRSARVAQGSEKAYTSFDNMGSANAKFSKGVSSGASVATKAVSDMSRLQHGYDSHAAELGLKQFTGKSWGKERMAWTEFNKNIISNPDKTFTDTLGKGNNKLGVTGYYKNVDGSDVAALVFNEGPNKGVIATTIKPSLNQLKSWGIIQ